MKLEMTREEFIEEVIKPFIITMTIMLPICLITTIAFIIAKG